MPLTYKEKIGAVITIAFIVALALGYLIDNFMVLPAVKVPFLNYLEKDKNIVSETLNYALSDFIIITKYFSKRVRVIWSSPPQLSTKEYLSLNPIFYLIVLTLIPMLISDFTPGKMIKDYIIEYFKPVVLVTILFGMFNGLRVFGSIGYYFAFLSSIKYEYNASPKEINALSFYFLTSHVTKWVIAIGLLALISFIPLVYISRDSIASFIFEFINLALNSVFYFATYVLAMHLAITGYSIGAYVLTLTLIILPALRLLMLRKKAISFSQ